MDARATFGDGDLVAVPPLLWSGKPRTNEEEQMAHAATIEQTADGFEVKFPECGTVGSADDEALADLVKRFHDEAFQPAVGSDQSTL